MTDSQIRRRIVLEVEFAEPILVDDLRAAFEGPDWLLELPDGRENRAHIVKGH